MPLVVGDRFTVKSDTTTAELRSSKGFLIGKYLPGQSYKVTGKNLDMANSLVDAGKAVAGEMRGV